MSLLAALLLGLLLVLTLRQSRRPLASPTFQLFRVLLPSWRFFEDIEPGPALLFRVATAGQDFGPWHEALVPRAGAGSFLLNAEGNLALAYQSVVEQLLSDLDGALVDEAPGLVSYQLVQRLVALRARELGLVTPDARYVFRLASSDSREVAFDSAEHRF